MEEILPSIYLDGATIDGWAIRAFLERKRTILYGDGFFYSGCGQQYERTAALHCQAFLFARYGWVPMHGKRALPLANLRYLSDKYTGILTKKAYERWTCVFPSAYTKK